MSVHVRVDPTCTTIATKAPRRGTHRPPRLRRIAAALALTVATVAALAALAELVASRSDDKNYPPPGRLLTIGEAQMHLRCIGSGHPTVLLEAGLGESSLTWVDLQSYLASHTRVCSYDRAGYGWSEPRERPWTARAAAEELRALLAAAREAGPYVVVAHSIGSFVAREWAATDPDSVQGLVLLDPTNDKTVSVMGIPRSAIVERHVLGVLARLGMIRLGGRWLVPRMVDAAPPDDLMRQLPAAYRATSIATSIQELRGSVDSAKRLSDIESAAQADIPIVVVSTATTSNRDRGHHADLASRSDQGHHIVMNATGHYAHYERPIRVTAVVRNVLRRLVRETAAPGRHPLTRPVQATTR